MAEEYDFLFKSIVVGDGGVGKTALTLRFSKGFFTEDYKMTIGVDFHVKTISIETAEGLIKCKLQLWDTGGQERFSSIRPMYYRGSLGAVLVFDLTNYSSFEHLPQWIEEVRANIKAEIPLLLVGNKSDLTDQRAVSLREVNNFTRDFNLYYMETSAKTGDGVGDCFYILACLMIGSGVPDKLINNETVFGPGQIPLKEPSVSARRVVAPEPQIDYTAPPVPEPEPTIERQPEIDYAAPPVPEPVPSIESQPEIDYAAPPVPEPPSVKSIMSPPKDELEPEISLPEQSEIEFKTPEEILSEKSGVSQQEFHLDKIIDTVEPETYKPRNIPFSPFTAEPTKPPEGFPSIEKTKTQEEELPSKAPFQVIKREEPTKPKPASMTFNPPSQELQTTEEKIPPSKEPSSQSLVDYMPQTILSKKEKKKLEKEKKKKEKKKREKKEFLEISGSSSLFQTLTQRTGEITEEKGTPSLPFVATKKIESEETSKLRIIPNIADTETQPSGFMPITPPSAEKQKPSSKSQDLLVCKQCGAVLSSDYAFCNKCGSKL